MELARRAATNGGGRAVELARRAAGSKPVKSAGTKTGEALVKSVAGAITAGGGATVARRIAERRNRRLAVDLAGQIGGTYSEGTVIAGDRYFVVWQGETPFDVFPALPKGLEPLAERRELQDYQGARSTPPRRGGTA